LQYWLVRATKECNLYSRWFFPW